MLVAPRRSSLAVNGQRRACPERPAGRPGRPVADAMPARLKNWPDDVDITVRTRSTAAERDHRAGPEPGLASENWLTMAEPRVAPGAISEWGWPGGCR